MTQSEQILGYLKTGKTLTPLEALYDFDCFRLSARIHDLKAQGWPITCDLMEVNGNKKVGHYYLTNDMDLWPKQKKGRSVGGEERP